eukprot:CAMPEP_0202959850 /NCGR_PEP_ID=MMETSP1396-20130829/4032_1 /ASSEMBLY_ACC=CAM_ASM_000872 /TAXON_ID= /ORGANISM="Pseudokeronopsis sp., Strain Brazil" /LENGTH=101 /DNA_ID=CAMNT_0049678673 /DNA_START=35 /DNA_END=340 /DNA_ORIENTATION=-
MSNRDLGSNNHSPSKENEQYYEDGHYDDEYQQNMGSQFEGNGEEGTYRLADQRQQRKKAEDDVKLLANRIQLLKMEEKKAWKKIEETKKKAREIMQVRQRN